MREIKRGLKAMIAPGRPPWHGASMLSALSRRLQDYARIAEPMLIYGLGGGGWAMALFVVLRRFWPRLVLMAQGAPPLNTPVCTNPQCDFSMFWPSGLLARAHQFAALYQSAPFLAFRQHIFTPATQRIDWIYPPPALLLTMPASLLPFDTSFLAWSAGLTLAGALLLRWSRLPWLAVLGTLLCPAALWNYECGQISLLTAGLFVAGLLRMDDAPKRGGALLGLLVIKPQLGLLVAVALVATRNWRAGLAALASAAAACLLITAWLGLPVWQAYFAYGAPIAKQILNAPLAPHSYETFGVSVFWMLRSFGASLQLAGAVQSAAALAAAMLVWRVWRGPRPVAQKFAITAWAALLATPYGYTNDMIAASAGLAALLAACNARLGLLLPLLWLWPAISPAIASAYFVELTPLVTLLALLWCWRAGRTQPAAQRRIVPA